MGRGKKSIWSRGLRAKTAIRHRGGRGDWVSPRIGRQGGAKRRPPETEGFWRAKRLNGGFG